MLALAPIATSSKRRFVSFMGQMLRCRMPASLDGKLVVAISSRAVFDFEQENRVFEEDDDAAYMALQRDRLDVPADPGVAWALVRKLLQFDPPDRTERDRRVEVVVV